VKKLSALPLRLSQQALVLMLPALLACVVLYAPHFDDFLLADSQSLLSDRAVLQFSPARFDNWRTAALGDYGGQPGAWLTRMSFALQVAVQGGVDPASGRVFNLALFLLATLAGAVLIQTLLLSRLSPATEARRVRVAAALAMCVWCLLPSQVDTVMHIADRGLLLSTLLVLAGVYLYLRLRQRWLARHGGAVAACRLAALTLALTAVAAGCHGSGWLLPVYVLATELLWLRRAVPAGRQQLSHSVALVALVLVWSVAAAFVSLQLAGTASLTCLAAFGPCLLLGWFFTVPPLLARRYTALLGLPLLAGLVFLTFLQAAPWQSALRLAERDYISDPDGRGRRETLAAAYYTEAARQTSDAAAQRYLVAARELYAQAAQSFAGSVNAHAGLVLVDSLLGMQPAQHYPALAAALEQASIGAADVESLRRLMACSARGVCPAPPGGFAGLLRPAANRYPAVGLGDLVLQYCIARRDYSCARSEAEAVLQRAPQAFVAYQALYVAARAEDDIAAAQAVVLRMMQADPARRWSVPMADFAAGRL
jgi:hypothetical protein